jgi:hypothetical protein
VSDTNRRRLDQALDPDFTSGLDEIGLDELRERRAMCSSLEIELSYQRRLLHGRMDLLAFEMRRRSGEEEESLIEALPRILAEGGYGSSSGLPARAVPVVAPAAPEGERRLVDRALSDDFLVRLPTMSDDDLRNTQAFLTETEVEVSKQRRQVHGVIDALQAELARRYREGLAAPTDQAPTG